MTAKNRNKYNMNEILNNLRNRTIMIEDDLIKINQFHKKHRDMKIKAM